MTRTEWREVKLGLGGVPLMSPWEAAVSWVATLMMLDAVVLGIIALANESVMLGIVASMTLLVSWVLLAASRELR